MSPKGTSGMPRHMSKLQSGKALRTLNSLKKSFKTPGVVKVASSSQPSRAHFVSAWKNVHKWNGVKDLTKASEALTRPENMKERGRCSWIYALCSSGGEVCAGSPPQVYVGMTVRLRTRLREHVLGCHTKNTAGGRFKTVLAVYKYSHAEWHNHELEKNMTLAFMSLFGWENVRGAGFCREKHTRPAELNETTEYTCPTTCKCGMPVGKDKTKDGRAYVYCPRGRMQWLGKAMGGMIQVRDEGCGYFEWKSQ